ncbi:hypothetical protein GCM10011511_15300 [Puia dinghuensis]|uniref:Uncharacterized protein n=2 Tax=Puia dinghuensis TaxID=1792502 RepID=A0A8J2UBC4_9BACT|nr:hypothetical protein GCM10011511_15300 [Puia dinghuensis]
MLTGHVDRETAYLVKTKQNGQIRKSKYCWIDTMLGIGDRLVTIKIDPVTRKPGKEQHGPDQSFIYFFKDGQGRLKHKSFVFKYNEITNKKVFPSLVKEINTKAITDLQKFNIRIDIMRSFKRHANIEFAYRKGTARQRYGEWMNTTLLHMKNCPFDQLANYPDPPPYRRRIR